MLMYIALSTHTINKMGACPQSKQRKTGETEMSIPANIMAKVLNKCTTGIEWGGSTKGDMRHELKRARLGLKPHWGGAFDNKRADRILWAIESVHDKHSEQIKKEVLEIINNSG